MVRPPGYGEARKGTGGRGVSTLLAREDDQGREEEVHWRPAWPRPGLGLER